jgi:hypothetical protein
MTDYEPGVCNINQVEQKKRLVTGIAGFLNAGLSAAVILLFPEFTPVYAAVFLLSGLGFLGMLQYRNSFCAGLGIRSQQHTSDEAEEVQDAESISADRKKSLTILAESILGAAALTFLVYFATTL